MRIMEDQQDPGQNGHSLTQPEAPPSLTAVASLPLLEEVAALEQLDERAQAVGAATAVLQRFVAHQLSRRVRAALTLWETHGWTPQGVYTELGVSRRTFTNWRQRQQEKRRPDPDGSGTPMPEGEARRTAVEAHELVKAWQPVLEQFIALRTATYRDLITAGRSDRQARSLLSLGREQGRAERQRALQAGVRPPQKIPDSARVRALVEWRIKNRVDGYEAKLPGELTLAAQLTTEWDRPVHRSVVTLAYQQLRAAGVIHSVRKVGWFVTAPEAAQAPDAAAC